ncbi:hypothetical protein Tco_1327336 [Tanacetum coccineum]
MGVNILKSIDEGPFQMGTFQETLAEGNEGALHLAVKLNRGLRDSNYDQLYAYLKQHEAHTNENKIMVDRLEDCEPCKGTCAARLLGELRTEFE